MDTPEIRQMLEDHKVPSCDTGTLGWAIGHLYDHGLNRSEIESVVGYILDGIEKVKTDPELHAAVESLSSSVERARA